MAAITLQKWGNSQGVRIPKVLLDLLQWGKDEKLNISTEGRKIVIEPANEPLTIQKLFAGYKGSYEGKEIDWGKQVGKEVW